MNQSQYAIVAVMIVLIAIATLAFVTNVFATKDPYDSGYDHGCDDATISDPDDYYINQDGKGPSNHTDEFMNGYNDGYSSCSGYGTESQPSQSQSQASSNENTNTNSLSQSQATTIYVCKEGGCTAQ
jgi:hypothetical protein